MKLLHQVAGLFAGLLLTLGASPALADGMTVKDSTGATKTVCTRTSGGVEYPCHVMYGMNGSTPTAFSTDGSGNLGVNIQNALTVLTHGVTQSGAWNITNITGAISLPTGAATAAAQSTAQTSLSSIVTNTAAGATSAKQDTAQTSFTAMAAVLGTTGDTAWSGTGTATLAAAMKALYAKLEEVRVAAVDPTAVPVNLAAATTGGCTPYGYQSAASTNSTNVKASAGTLCSLNVINTTATLYYLRMYNLASAPTCSSATGFVKTVPVPASTTGAGVALDLGAFGEAYGTGLGFCLTGGGSSTDNTNAATGVYVMASYK